MEPSVQSQGEASPAPTTAEIVIRPIRRSADGLGVYDSQAISFAKALRAQGAEVTFEDPPNSRRFLTQNGADAIGAAIALSIASAAAYDLVKAALRAASSAMQVRLSVLDRSSGWMQDLEGTPLEIASTETAWEPPDDDASNADSAVAASVHGGFGSTSFRLSHVPEIQARLSEAEATIEAARLLSETDVLAAEPHARRALAQFASALNWAEDGVFENSLHARMDGVGRWVSKTFGCALHYEDGVYSQDCPVALGHNRVGMSVGGLAVKTCSVCGEDLAECPHMPGSTVNVPGGIGPLRWCRVCLSTEACEHLATETYRSRVASVITGFNLEEVSFVRRPAMPDARATSRTFTIDELRANLGEDFEPGAVLACVRCEGPCTGFGQLEGSSPDAQ